MKVGQHKMQFIEEFKSEIVMLSGNSMGIYFEVYSENKMLVHFKPLNEDFQENITFEGNGVLVNFERDLINEDDIEYALDVMMLFNKHPQLQINKADKVSQIQQLISLVRGEFFNQAVSYIILKTLLKALLLHLIRFQNDGFLKQDLNQKRIFQFLELMESSFLKETTTIYYANQMGISSKRLNQVLKEKLNLTAKQVIQQRQITEAKRELVRGEITTKELAFLLGFDSVSSFSRFFKKHVDVSPSVFKTL